MRGRILAVGHRDSVHVHAKAELAAQRLRFGLVLKENVRPLWKFFLTLDEKIGQLVQQFTDCVAELLFDLQQIREDFVC